MKENNYISTLEDECFFRRYDEKGNLQEFVIVHVDDLAMDGSIEFVDNTVALLKKNLTISKVVKGNFRFCGLDLFQKVGKTVLSMEDYAKSMFLAPIPAKIKKKSSLTAKQLTILRAQIGSLSWLSMNVRMDLSYETHELSKRMANATIKDLQYSNYLVKKAN